MDKKQTAMTPKEKSKKAINLTSSQTEISDEEIEKEGLLIFENEGKNIYKNYNTVPSWVEGAKWYREQLKKK